MSVFDVMSTTLAGPGAFVFGLIVGSFANVCIHRLPRGQSIVRPRSRCPRCGRAIAAWDNVPLLSYVVLLGRCRSCRASISPRYPAIEALNGAAYWAVVAMLGPTPRAAMTMAFVTSLLVLAFIDFEHYILPDAITIPGVVAGFLAAFVPGWPVSFLSAMIGAAAGYAGFASIAWAYRRTRAVEGLGRGDWKMAAMLGAFLGWEKLLLAVFIAACAGTLVGLPASLARGQGLKRAVPFGSFLALGALLVLFFGDPVLAWYRGLLRV